MRQAILIAGLGFGDEGKGSIVDFLVRETGAHTVVRYNGGPQAGHNVVLPDGRHHTFSQFGSGTFVPGTQTYLSRHMWIAPGALLREAVHLEASGVPDALARLIIDGGAGVITPFQRAANRIRELARGPARHGSCGMGVGEAQADFLKGEVLLAHELHYPQHARWKLERSREHKRREIDDLAPPTSDAILAAYHVFEDPEAVDRELQFYEELREAATIGTNLAMLNRSGTIIFEGAQGVLLDQWHGFHPYTTWSDTTFTNAELLLRQCEGNHYVTRLGVLRTYATRHGPGPFPTETEGLRLALQDPRNPPGDWQGPLRIGWPDLVATRYALDVLGPIDGIALTHLDYLDHLHEWRACVRYELDPTGLQPTGGPTISRLPVGHGRAVASQEALTSLLQEARPLYERIGCATPGDFVVELEDILGCRVSIVSVGPSAEEKIALSKQLRRAQVHACPTP